MANFPRTLVPMLITPFRVPTGLVARGQTGKDQRRSIVAMGREWDERWPPLRVGTPDVDALLAYLEDAYNQQTVFQITHLLTPGSGKPPHGAGGGSPRVNGASQTGATINTDGWTASITNVVRAGDVVRIQGFSPLVRVVANASSNASGQATVTISPPIPVGSSPPDDGVITRTGCTIDAYIAELYGMQGVPPDEFLMGLGVTFREAL